MIITASFEDKMQTVRLPSIEQEVAFWDFMEILFEELRCEMFYTKEKKVTVTTPNKMVDAGGAKSKKRRNSSESTATGDVGVAAVAEQLTPESDKKRRRLQVNIKRLDAATASAAGGKKSRLSLGREKSLGGESTPAAVTNTASSSSSSSSPVHSPSHSLSPANSTASSRQDKTNYLRYLPAGTVPSYLP